MVTIYCIEDCNSLKYVGSTKQKLNRRISEHKKDKKRNYNISSSKLDLDNCKIYSLETCNESIRIERERYWIDKIDCVNHYKLQGLHREDIKEYHRDYRKNNKEYFKEHDLFRKKSVVNGSYEFINMLNEY